MNRVFVYEGVTDGSGFEDARQRRETQRQLRRVEVGLAIAANAGTALMLAWIFTDQLPVLLSSLGFTAVSIVLVIRFVLLRRYLPRPKRMLRGRLMVVFAWFPALGVTAWLVPWPWVWIPLAVLLLILVVTVGEIERRERERAQRHSDGAHVSRA